MAMSETSRRLVSLFLVATTLLIVVVVATSRDLTHQRHYHHHQQQQQQQQDHPSRMLSYDDASRQTGYRCDDVCELRQSVHRLSATQLDYGRALHTVYGLVDTVRRELIAARYTMS